MARLKVRIPAEAGAAINLLRLRILSLPPFSFARERLGIWGDLRHRNVVPLVRDRESTRTSAVVSISNYSDARDPSVMNSRNIETIAIALYGLAFVVMVATAQDFQRASLSDGEMNNHATVC